MSSEATVMDDASSVPPITPILIVKKSVTFEPLTPESPYLAKPKKRKRSPSPTSDSRAHDSIEPLKPLPPSILLLSLPRLLAHPPNHPSYVPSLILSLRALRKCLSLPGLPNDVECLALTALAEIGLKIIRAGWTQNDKYPWAKQLETETTTAIGRALILSQSHPALINYKLYLLLLHARIENWRQNVKSSRALVKRLQSSFLIPSLDGGPANILMNQTPSWLVYATHLADMSHDLSIAPPDLQRAFSTLGELTRTAEAFQDTGVVILAHVLRLRFLVDAGVWKSVGDALSTAEVALGLIFDTELTPKKTSEGEAKDKNAQTFLTFEDPFEAAMAIHVLMMGVVYFTHVGNSKASSPRLTQLHSLLDSDALKLFPKGLIRIKLTRGMPLVIKCTHPRVLYQLAYLVSSIAKRDAVGRKPKRKVFTMEGLKVGEKERKKETQLDICADPLDEQEIDERLVKIRADLLSEFVAVCIMRSEFEDAKTNLDELIAHTRDYNMFNTYSARITLHHAHLAHAVGDADRALLCYRVAANRADPGTFVNVSARCGELGLRLGLNASGREGNDYVIHEEEVKEVVQACSGMGSTLEALGLVLQAVAGKEITTAKSYLKTALDLSSRSQDNHLRALVLTLLSALYFRTAEGHARAMLETAGQLAAGLGAPPVKAVKEADVKNDETPKQNKREDAVPPGNAPLGRWIGQRFLELYKKEGNERKARKQEELNGQFERAVQSYPVRVPKLEPLR